MTPRACWFLVLLCWLLICRVAPPCGAAQRQREQVISLEIADGEPDDPGRVFSLPVECNGVAAQFELGGFGVSRISQSLADRVHALILPDSQLSRHHDPDGKPIFAGSAFVSIALGGMEQDFRVAVMKDAYCQKPEKQGMLGYDVLREFQWEVDPSAPSLTLRPLATPPASKPLAILPLRTTGDGAFVRIRIRNVTEELGLMPGSSFVQAGPRLQRAWDFSSGKKLEIKDMDVNRFGDVRTIRLHGQDVVELTRDLRETDLLVALIGDPKNLNSTTMESSGLGQCVLNRFVYCVDARRRQLRLMSRVPEPPAARITPAPARSRGR